MITLHGDGARLRGQRPGPPPKPESCAFCGWTADETWLRVGDDRRFVQVGTELICSLCATPADRGSKQYSPTGALRDTGR